MKLVYPSTLHEVAKCGDFMCWMSKDMRPLCSDTLSGRRIRIVFQTLFSTFGKKRKDSTRTP